MYEAHALFQQPPDETKKVWRYMDFTKLVSMLELRTLYFARADKLGDSFEGSYPRINILARQQVPVALPPEHRDKYPEIVAFLSEENRQWPTRIAINCWHLNDHESAAMWKLYLKSNEGIAIQSTYQKLRDCFANEQDPIFLGKVNYIDYDTEWIKGEANLLSPFVHKRMSFKHEDEVRAVIVRWPWKEPAIDHGLHIPVDLGSLIERIYIAPDSPHWFESLVKSVVERYGYAGVIEVVDSKLKQRPLF